MSPADGQDEPDETPDERASSPPDSLAETLAQIQALIDEAIAILEHRVTRHS
jgi:hypothetical protein